MKSSEWISEGIPDSVSEERCRDCSAPVIVSVTEGSVIYLDIMSTFNTYTLSESGVSLTRSFNLHECAFRTTTVEDGTLTLSEARRLVEIEIALERECPSCHQPPDAMCISLQISGGFTKAPHKPRYSDQSERISRVISKMTAMRQQFGSLSEAYKLAMARECPSCKAHIGQKCFNMNDLKSVVREKARVTVWPHRPRLSDEDLISLMNNKLLTDNLYEEMVSRKLIP